MSRPLSVDMRRTLALLLAGGVGSRLNVLVHRRAKPAVPFGSVYRIIDFAMSNIMSSGLERVGILTQYMPYSLTDHIGRGEPWGMVGRSREARILPPHTGHRDSDWYLGTADAIYRNKSYIDRHDPDLVLILSGDHVYRMNYGAMVAHHLESGADATIAVLEVPIEEAPSFGTVLVDASDRITGFEEKPEKPGSNLISMGIYCFGRRILCDQLDEVIGEQQKTDFGRHVFPQMLDSGLHLQAYRFDGYWQDVGTIRAYYDCHMEMLSSNGGLDLENWKVRTNWDEKRAGDRPPARFAPTARVGGSVVARGGQIAGRVQESVLSPGVVVEEGAVVERSILMNDVRIGEGARVIDAIVDKQSVIGPGAVVGGHGLSTPNYRFPTHLQSGLVLIGKGAHIPKDARIERNAILFPEVTLPRGEHAHVGAGQTIGETDL